MKKYLIILFLALSTTMQSQFVGFQSSVSNQSTQNPNIVSNGTFDSSTDWSLASGWAISGGVLTGTAVTSLATNTPITNPVNGVTYVATFDVSNYTSNGDFAIRVGGTNSADTGAGNGSYSIEIVSGADGTIRVDGRAPAFSGDIDNLEIREK